MTKISIVEDLPDVVKSIVDNISLSNEFKVVGTYAYGEKAVEMLPYDGTEIVLLDLGLAGEMMGIEAMVKMLEANPKLQFLIFTIFEEDSKLFDALRYGAAGYILKKDGILGVLSALKELKKGGGPMSRYIASRVLKSFREPDRKDILIEQLTPTQNKVLALVSEGLLNKEIASKIGVTEQTIKTHLHAVFKKLHVNNRVEAVKIYLGY